MVRPPLVAAVADRTIARLQVAPEIAPRAWALAVVSLQVGGEGGVVRAVARAHATGQAAPVRVALPDRAVLHVALGDPPARWPAVAPIDPGAAAARIAVYRDGAPVDEVALTAAAPGVAPPPRAFGHVFCRHRRDGGHQAGFDLTEFWSLPPGAKFARRLSLPLAVGEVVSYAVAVAAAAAPAAVAPGA